MEQDLVVRIEALERSRRRTRAMSTLIASMAVGAVLLGAGPGRSTEPLLTEGLTIIGPEGAPRIELSADARGAWIHMRDGRGTLLASLGTSAGAGRLLLLGEGDATLATLGPSQTGDGQLALGGPEGSTQVRLGTWSKDGGRLWFRTPTAPHTPPATP